MTDLNIILFDDFETLDVFGPVEIFGRMEGHYNLKFFSEKGSVVTSTQNVETLTRPFAEITPGGILLIPGGMATRTLVNNSDYTAKLGVMAEDAKYVLTVCTGTALLAKTKVLNGISATSNKRAFEWVCSLNHEVKWVKEARWVADGRFYTSSGVSAGMDMALGFIADMHGLQTAEELAFSIEYTWHRNKGVDPFAR